jgi:probable addiction module antidote protein
MSMARKAKEKVGFSRFDVSEHLKTEKDMAAYLDACMEEGGDNPAFIAVALGHIARARGMAQLAKETGLTREGLYATLSARGNPSLGTVLRIMKALGVRLSAKPA